MVVPALSAPGKNTQHEAQQSCLAFSLNCQGRNLRSEEGEKVILRQKTWQCSCADGRSSLSCRQGRFSCLVPSARLTFGSVVLLFGALASFPPLSLQDFQAVVLLQLQNGQVKVVTEHRACNTERCVLRHCFHQPPSPLIPATVPDYISPCEPLKPTASLLGPSTA